MSTPHAPWDIYAQQLGNLGYGYPLWVPDPAPGSSPIEIGDVGWINRGEFQPLFNAFRGEDEAQPRGGVPVDHVPLDIRDCIISGPRDDISQSMLCSTSIRRVDISGEASGALPLPNVSCDVNFKFVCTDEAGALLFISPSGRTKEILSRKRIRDYIGAHFDRWMEFANNRLQIGLREDQILFVSGTTKTSRWGVAAFRDTAREKRGAVTGNLGSLAAMDFSVSISNSQLSPSHYRTGPTERLIGPCPGTSPPKAQFDQCVFIHYYKRRRRRLPLFPSTIKAAAGPHDLPRNPDDGDDHRPCATNSLSDSDDSSNDSEFVHFPKQIPMKHTTDYILDYILENSPAAVAIASDTDLIALGLRQSQNLEGLAFPKDIPRHLTTIKPPIVLSRDLLGSLSDIQSGDPAGGLATSLNSTLDLTILTVDQPRRRRPGPSPGGNGRWFEPCERCYKRKLRCDFDEPSKGCGSCARNGSTCIQPRQAAKTPEQPISENMDPMSDAFFNHGACSSTASTPLVPGTKNIAVESSMADSLTSRGVSSHG